jgi:hypothetical protein
MFGLSVVDHLRLAFGHVVQNYNVHARASERWATLALKARVTVLVLFIAATASMVVSLLRDGGRFQIAATIVAGVAVAAYALYIALGLESRVAAHRACAHRLWLMCERYRALLAEIRDGLLDKDEVLRRRDELIQQTHAVYEQAFSVDQQAFESVRQLSTTGSHGGLTDREIDEFLPESLKTFHGTATDTSAPH